MPKELKLKVAEAIQDDVNKGIIRIDSSFMQELGVKPGDIVSLKGQRDTVSIVDRAYPGDIGLPIVRMDGLIRRNAKTGIGETVVVNKIEVREAKKVVIAPASKGVMIKAESAIFKQGLLGRAVLKGDIISLGGAKRRSRTLSGAPFFDDVFQNLMDDVGNFGGFGFSDIKFIVADVNPKGAVIIGESTEVEFNPEAVEVSDEKVLEVTYEDIGGLDDEMKKIREMVELPLKHPELFERLGIEAPKGVLLHGPPGTGKTMLAKAVANETNSNFILINGPELMSKFYGQSEANIRKKFEEAEKNAPSIIFIDEIDAIAPKREETHGEVEKRVVATILALMDGLKSRGRVVVIAATNIPNALDPALRRPGRFDRELEIGVPNVKGRQAVLGVHTRSMPLLTQPESINKRYDDKKIEEEVKNIFSAVGVDTLLSSITKNAKDKVEFKEASIPVFTSMLKGLISDKCERNVKDFLDESLSKFSEFLANQILNYIKIEVKTIKKDNIEKNIPTVVLDEDAHEKLQLKFKEFQKEDGVKDLISNVVKTMILEDIASMTHGFVGADLAALSKESAMVVLRRILPDLKLDKEDPIPKEILERLHITKDDFKEALKVVRPSALREVFVEVPNVKWEDVGGLKPVKQELREAVEWPLKNPAMFKRLGVKPPKGILMYGPPGTGKTMLAKAVANESEANFILVNGPSLLSKWVGESEKAVREVFKKARQASPTIIFFDEIDALAPRRGLSSDNHVAERMVNQLLTEMDGLTELNDIVVIAATNRPDILDPALLRPGRFDRIILTPAPDLETRKEIFKIHTKMMPLADNVDIAEMASHLEGYVGADIEAVCREAAILTLRKDNAARKVGKVGFEAAMKKIVPSVTKEIENEYEELKKNFSSATARQMSAEKPAYFG